MSGLARSVQFTARARRRPWPGRARVEARPAMTEDGAGPAPGPQPLPPLARAFLAVGLLLFFVLAVLHFGAPVLLPAVEAIVVWFVLNAAARACAACRGPARACRKAWRSCSRRWSRFVVGFLVVESSVRTAAPRPADFAGFRTALGPLVDALRRRPRHPGRGLSTAWSTAIASSSTRCAQRRRGHATTISHFSIVAIYVAFLLVDQQFFDLKLRALSPDPSAAPPSRR